MDQVEAGDWLTYAEAAARFGITAEAARQLAKRRKWPRHTPNEHGATARILVPFDTDVRPRRPPRTDGARRSRSYGGRRRKVAPLDARRAAEDVHVAANSPIVHPDDRDSQAVEAFRAVVADLLLRLDMADDRARQSDERARLAELEAARLRAELTALRSRSWWRRLRNR